MSIRVMSDVLDHAPVSGSKLLVLVALANFADDDGVCWPAMSTIAAKARLAERSAQRACRDMEQAGLLEISESAGPNGVNRYRIVCAAFRGGGSGATTSGSRGDRLSPLKSLQGVTQVSPGG